MDGIGIERREVEDAIQKGMKWRERDEKWHATKSGVECVFVKKEKNFLVITVYRNGGNK